MPTSTHTHKPSFPPNQLRHYRRHHRCRLQDIAERLQLRNVSNVSAWEKGHRIPSLTNALKLSAVLTCPVEILFLEYFRQIRRRLHQCKRE